MQPEWIIQLSVMRNPILLFDIDGTLLSIKNGLHFQAFEKAMKKIFGIEAERGPLKVAGMLDRHIIMEILKLKGIPINVEDPVLDETCREIGKIYIQDSGGADLTPYILPGARELLEAAHRMGIPSGLVTGNVEEVAWEKMRLSTLLPHLERFGGFGCAMVRTRAELIPIALSGASALLGRNFESSDAIVVGDTPRDVEAARSAGARVVAVKGTYKKEELALHNPDVLVDSLHPEGTLIEFLSKS